MSDDAIAIMMAMASSVPGSVSMMSFICRSSCSLGVTPRGVSPAYAFQASLDEYRSLMPRLCRIFWVLTCQGYLMRSRPRAGESLWSRRCHAAPVSA